MDDKGLERVLIVGVELPSDDIDIDTSMDELQELVKAAGGIVISRVIQRKEGIHPAHFIGKGKAEEIRHYCDELDVSTVVFNDELSGAQLRNLEKLVDKKIIDRTNLILDIFANRAKTSEGKLQVKLAQLKYRLPRLIGYSDYLSRTGGGIGTRGPGEQKLETDRRHILREIDNIENQLREVEKVRSIKRKQREESSLPIVALVGYTNAGKSTLLNGLIEFNDETQEKKEVYVEDMLFATLDTSLRRSKLPNGQIFLLTDTVGFVSKLPTRLIEAFKGTLEEVKYADLLLHVVDASSENLDIQINTTLDILKDLKVLDKPMIFVFNKMDKVDIQSLIYDHKLVENKIFISAKNKVNLEDLMILIEDLLPQLFRKVDLLIPYTHQNVVSYFMNNYEVSKMEYKEVGTELSLVINQIDYERYQGIYIRLDGDSLKEIYRTVKGFGEDEIIINKSRFIGYASPIESEEDALDFIEMIKTKHRDATHNVYAYVYGEDSNIQRFSDDGEPSGTAGIPVLEVIKKEDLRNLVIVVSRYFGGVKLGGGGLIRAYTKSAKIGLDAGKIVDMTLHTKLSIIIPYTLLGKFENFLSVSNYKAEDMIYKEEVEILIYLMNMKMESFIEDVMNLSNGLAEITSLEEKHLPAIDGTRIY